MSSWLDVLSLQKVWITEFECYQRIGTFLKFVYTFVINSDPICRIVPSHCLGRCGITKIDSYSSTPYKVEGKLGDKAEPPSPSSSFPPLRKMTGDSDWMTRYA